ncbi:hypothetical protein QUA43_03870 [Microcoleus sp. N9_B4]|uniref:hypothetical protein n=1 Tax=Microcoleus sp. N9_B4 TaxID=3055386 RepID=UPI002FCEDC07
MAANHSIAIDLLFHLMAVTDIDELSPLITEILGTEELGFRKPSFSRRHRSNLEFRYRLNRKIKGDRGLLNSLILR